MISLNNTTASAELPSAEEARRITGVGAGLAVILGDTVETVTPYLVDGILRTNKTNARVAWLTKGKAFRRFRRDKPE